MRQRRWAESHGLGLRSLNLPAVKTIDKLSQARTQKDLHLRIVTLTEGSYLEEDCSLGDSTLGSSEKLFQRGMGDGQYICDFGKWGIHAIQRIFFL